MGARNVTPHPSRFPRHLLPLGEGFAHTVFVVRPSPKGRRCPRMRTDEGLHSLKPRSAPQRPERRTPVFVNPLAMLVDAHALREHQTPTGP